MSKVEFIGIKREEVEQMDDERFAEFVNVAHDILDEYVEEEKGM